MESAKNLLIKMKGSSKKYTVPSSTVSRSSSPLSFRNIDLCKQDDKYESWTSSYKKDEAVDANDSILLSGNLEEISGDVVEHQLPDGRLEQTIFKQKKVAKIKKVVKKLSKKSQTKYKDLVNNVEVYCMKVKKFMTNSSVQDDDDVESIADDGFSQCYLDGFDKGPVL